MGTKLNYSALRDRCDAYARSVNARARVLTKEAGLDPNLLGIHPHNAMCSYRSGHPWPGVDYKKVRKVLWLVNERQWAANRLLSALYARKGWDAFDWNAR